MLSRAATTLVHVPLFDAEAPLGREELEEVAGPVLARTVTAVRSVLDRAGIENGQVAAVFLAGGSSRMPAVATVLHRALGIAPTIVEQPELAVAEGSLRTVESAGDAEATTGVSASPPGIPAHVSTVRPRRRLALVAGLTLALVAAAGVAGATALGGDDEKDPAATPTTPSASPTPSPTSSPTPSIASQMDPCTVGTWRSTSTQSFTTIGGDQVQLTGGAGIVLTYKPDGTAALDYDKSQDSAATQDGVRWSERTRGKVALSIRHTDGKEYISNVKANGTVVLYRNGKRNNSVPLSLLLQPEEYFCSADRLEFHGTGVSVWTRVSPP
jgi:hypothetical protein